MKKCIHCGCENDDESLFCGDCGAKLESVSKPRKKAVDMPPLPKFVPEENEDYDALKEEVATALNEMSENERMALTLVHMNQKSVKEASEILNMDEEDVEKNLDSATEKLHGKLGSKIAKGATIPFLLWALKDQAEKASLSNIGVSAPTVKPVKQATQSVVKATKHVSSATKTAKTASTAAKVAGTTGTKVAAGAAGKAAISKVAIGVVTAAVVGTGAVVGGKTLLEHNNNSTSTTVQEEVTKKEDATEKKSDTKSSGTKYKVLDTKVPDFESTPIDVVDSTAYIVKVNGKYGVMDSSGEWAMDPKYTSGSFAVGSVACLANDSTENGGDDIAYTLGKSERPQCTGYGGASNGYITFDDENGVYLYDFAENTKTAIPSYLEGDTRIIYKTVNSVTTEYGIDYDSFDQDHYYILGADGQTIYGPYDKDEAATFSAYSSADDTYSIGPKFSKFTQYTDGGLNAKVWGIYYVKTDDGYVVYSNDGTKHTEETFDSATAISNNTIRVEKDGMMGIVDKDLNLVVLGDFEDITAVCDNKAYAKIKGTWKQIEIE